MAAKEAGKTILNTTRSSSERWTHFANKSGGELVNGKDRYSVTEFIGSEHPMKDTVVGWMTEKGIELPVPKGWDSVDTSVEKPAYIVPTTDADSEQAVRTIIHQNPPGSQRDTLVSMLYGDLNRTKGKGATRKLRKAVRAMGFGGLAALPAA